MGLKLTSISINRDPLQHAASLMCGLADGHGNFINVTVHLDQQQNLDALQIAEIERLALEAAKKLNP